METWQISAHQQPKNMYSLAKTNIAYPRLGSLLVFHNKQSI